MRCVLCQRGLSRDKFFACNALRLNGGTFACKIQGQRKLSHLHTLCNSWLQQWRAGFRCSQLQSGREPIRYCILGRENLYQTLQLKGAATRRFSRRIKIDKLIALSAFSGWKADQQLIEGVLSYPHITKGCSEARQE